MVAAPGTPGSRACAGRGWPCWAAATRSSRPGGELGPGQVYDANRPGVAAQAEAAGARVVAGRRRARRPRRDGRRSRGPPRRPRRRAARPAGDERRRLGGPPRPPAPGARGRAACASCSTGCEIRPGHPLWLGRRGEQLVLGLPGNPVSAAVCFHAFGRPLLGRADSWEHRMPMAARYVKEHAPHRAGALREDGRRAAPAAAAGLARGHLAGRGDPPGGRGRRPARGRRRRAGPDDAAGVGLRRVRRPSAGTSWSWAAAPPASPPRARRRPRARASSWWSARPALGGECTFTGCVPSKAIIEVAKLYRDAAPGGSPRHPRRRPAARLPGPDGPQDRR